VAVRRLHGVPGVAVHGAADHGRPVLFGEDCGPVPGMEDQGQGHVDGRAHVDHPGAVVLHQHIRLGTLCRLPGPVAGPVRRTVPQGSRVQHGADHRLLLDHAHCAVRAVRRHLQGGVRDAKEERGETAQDAVDGGAERGHRIRYGRSRGRHRHVQDSEHSARARQAAATTTTAAASATATDAATAAAAATATATVPKPTTAAATTTAGGRRQQDVRFRRERSGGGGLPEHGPGRSKRHGRGGGGQGAVEQSGIRVGRGEHDGREAAADQLATQKVCGRTHRPVGSRAAVQQRHTPVAIRQSHTVLRHVR